MIRDYWQVQPGGLGDEFRQIKGTADPLTWEAIESVRRSGMIGARMDSEGAEILDIDPDEAELLIGLIETLIEDWYVTREERRKRLTETRKITGKGVAEKKMDE
jgi:isocitrate lyase